MVTLEFADNNLILHIHGLASKAFALRGTMTIPLTHIKGVRAKPTELNDFGLQIFGVGLGGLAHGYFYVPGRGIVFADHTHGGKVVAVDLEHDHYKHLYVEVEGKEAEEVVKIIQAALPH